MTFTSDFFLIGLLPWFVLVAYLLRNVKNAKPILLLAANSLFYIWGGVGAFLFVICFTFFVWIFSQIVRNTRNKLIFGLIIAMVLFPLILVKYLVYFISIINSICHMEISNQSIIVPIGISFFTFEAISLLCDIYKERDKRRISVIQTYLYLTFFATIISGPIIRFRDFREGLYAPIDCKKYNNSIERIIFGLCKKVLIADKIAVLADYYFDGVAIGETYSILGLWIGSIAYTLQIYFDFSGYSDMAIGIGQLVGFNIGENFNRPYQARSISDFWKRWHISLSQWFRDYVYIPLGGNRCSLLRHIFNMFVVWLLTGIWHGAEWSFVIWGMGYFFLLVIEKYVPSMKRIGITWVGHIYTLFFVNLLWVLFRASNLETAKRYICGMIGIGGKGGIETIAVDYIPYIIVSVLLCFYNNRLFDRFEKKTWFRIIKGVVILTLMGLAICAVVNASYTPYIYGNF